MTETQISALNGLKIKLLTLGAKKHRTRSGSYRIYLTGRTQDAPRMHRQQIMEVHANGAITLCHQYWVDEFFAHYGEPDARWQLVTDE